MLAARPGGFPWLTVAGQELTGTTVVDLDVTVVFAASEKENTKPTYKGGVGFAPNLATCDNTDDMLVVDPRPGNATSNVDGRRRPRRCDRGGHVRRRADRPARPRPLALGTWHLAREDSGSAGPRPGRAVAPPLPQAASEREKQLGRRYQLVAAKRAQVGPSSRPIRYPAIRPHPRNESTPRSTSVPAKQADHRTPTSSRRILRLSNGSAARRKRPGRQQSLP